MMIGFERDCCCSRLLTASKSNYHCVNVVGDVTAPSGLLRVVKLLTLPLTVQSVHEHNVGWRGYQLTQQKDGFYYQLIVTFYSGFVLHVRTCIAQTMSLAYPDSHKKETFCLLENMNRSFFDTPNYLLKLLFMYTCCSTDLPTSCHILTFCHIYWR